LYIEAERIRKQDFEKKIAWRKENSLTGTTTKNGKVFRKTRAKLQGRNIRFILKELVNKV